jgi:L-threonylcarbamoyladenylate synthase
LKTGTDIHHAASLLRHGEVVAIPTETVYGLAANAYDPDAVLKIFKVKERPFFDPLIVHTWSIEQVDALVTDFPPLARKLAEALWPGPLTLVLKKSGRIPDLVTSGSETVAVRIPSHPLTLELLKLLDFPLAAPSANPFGYISPTTAQHVADQLGEKIPYILDGGTSNVGVESTIVSFEGNVPCILRHGGVSGETIEKLTGVPPISYKPEEKSQLVPGQLLSHYAPRHPLILGDIEEGLKLYMGRRIGILSFSGSFAGVPSEDQYIMSANGDIEEAAKNLFSLLRKLDGTDVEIILAGNVPDTGLGRAINDRLFRASQKKNK